MVQLALYGASRSYTPRRPRRTARLQRAQIADELPRAVFPGTLQRKTPASFAGDAECADASASQVGIQGANRVIRDHIKGPGHPKARHRRAAPPRFEFHYP